MRYKPKFAGCYDYSLIKRIERIIRSRSGDTSEDGKRWLVRFEETKDVAYLVGKVLPYIGLRHTIDHSCETPTEYDKGFLGYDMDTVKTLVEIQKIITHNRR